MRPIVIALVLIVTSMAACSFLIDLALYYSHPERKHLVNVGLDALVVIAYYVFFGGVGKQADEPTT